MALPQRPFNEAEARKMIEDWRKGWPKIPSFWERLQQSLLEPTPHKVLYRADDGVRYVPPKEFWFDIRPDGPSDCVWIVPGA